MIELNSNPAPLLQSLNSSHYGTLPFQSLKYKVVLELEKITPSLFV